ncbi:MAG TPA: hypothetical protein VF844_07200 [Ktedonobacteraceae bacterium]
MRAILHESFHLVSDESGFPEVRIERLVQERHEMVTDHLTGQREVWPVPFIVELQVAGGKHIAKGVVGAAQVNGRVSFTYDAVCCHDANAHFT